METRKVQLSGGTTYTVSLPKSWAREHGIEAGSVLHLHPDEDGTLLVESIEGRANDRRTVVFDVTQYDVAPLRETVQAAYLVGADEVVLKDRSGSLGSRESAVRAAASGLSGFEVVETTDRSITLQSLLDAEQISIRKSLLRLKLITLAMHRDAVAAVIEADDTLAEQVVDRDDEVDKLFALVTRHFRRSVDDLQEVARLGETRSDLFEYYYVARQLERVADHTVKMARLASQRDRPPEEPFRDRISGSADTASRIVENAADVVVADADVTVAHETLTRCDDLVAEIDALDRELYDHDEGTEAFTIGLLLDSIRRTAEYGRNVAEVAIQRTVRETVE